MIKLCAFLCVQAPRTCSEPSRYGRGDDFDLFLHDFLPFKKFVCRNITYNNTRISRIEERMEEFKNSRNSCAGGLFT